MKKVINPCRIDTGNKFKSPVYVAINFNEESGNLSITGVVGPLASGNCTGSCGQIVDELLDESRTMSSGWTPEMVDDLVAVWKEWHLNDMTPGSPRQMEFLRGKHLSYEAGREALEDAGILDDEEFWYDNAKRMQVQPTEAQAALWALYAKARHKHMAFAIKKWRKCVAVAAEIDAMITAIREPKSTYSWGAINALMEKADKARGLGDRSFMRRGSTASPIAALGRARPGSEDLNRPQFRSFARWVMCEHGPAAGNTITAKPYHYGSAWLKRDVPKYIIDELMSLPDATRQPAWV